jgi:16S rRNA processing protein RimM
MTDEPLLIGVIIGPFGVRGQVKVKAITDRPDHIARRVRTVLLGKNLAERTLKRLAEHKPGLLIADIDGVSTREAADELRGEEIYIRAADAAPLAEDEYFLHDLLGIAAVAEDGQPIGTVRDVMETGAGNILVIARPGMSDALVPMVRDFIAALDLTGRTVTIRPIEGLL